MTKTMLHDAKLDTKYWGEAVLTATYLQNRLPTRSTGKTPFELWHGYTPYIGHLKVFGAKAFSFIPKQLRRKLDNNAEEGVLIGYSSTTKGYRILNPATEKVTICRSVKFDEGQLPHEDLPSDLLDEEDDNISSNSKTEADDQILRRSNRVSHPPNRLVYEVEIHNAPQTWEDVQRLEEPTKSKWIKAADEEYKSLMENKTWTLVDLPKGQKAIGSKWVFKEKLLPDGTLTEKARLCALGYSQRPGVDFDETFSPVTKHCTIRAVLKIAAIRKMHIKHLDIKTAFLYGKLEDEIYMKQPQGYEKPGQEDKVCLLQRSLYGLKQSSRIWNKTVSTTFENMGFKQGDGDSCCFAKKEKDCLTIILLYVDDVLVLSDSQDKIEEVKTKLQSLYTTKDLGNPTHYVGLQIERLEDGSFDIHQTLKIKQLIECYNECDERKKSYTPMSTDYRKQAACDSDVLTPEKKKNYREIIGSLLYISNCTRPDISESVSALSRQVENPTKYHWDCIMRILVYLGTTMDLKLHISANDKQNEVEAYCDSDFAGDYSDRKSTSGFIVYFNGTPILWQSKKQTSTALSSTESEFISLANVSKEILWLIKLFKDFQFKDIVPVTVHEDNLPCINLLNNERYTSKLKHVDVKYNFVKEILQNNLINIKYCPTKLNIADIFTKPLPRIMFENLREKMLK